MRNKYLIEVVFKEGAFVFEECSAYFDTLKEAKKALKEYASNQDILSCKVREVYEHSDPIHTYNKNLHLQNTKEVNKD